MTSPAPTLTARDLSGFGLRRPSNPAKEDTMRTATTAYCPAQHNDDPAQTGPQANLVGTSEWSEEFGRVEVFVCSGCGAVFGLDRNGFFCPVPDDMVAAS